MFSVARLAAMDREVVIGRRFRGPPNSGNGGYASGVIAEGLEGAVTVTLRVPPPLDRAMTLSADGESNRLSDGDVLVGEARRSTLDLNVPASPPLEVATEASRHFAGFESHIFPGCFVCGPERGEGDGLLVFPGAVAGSEVVAAPWSSDESLQTSDGEIDRRYVWAALDCPSYFALVDAPIALLGRFTAQIDRLPGIGEPTVVIGWPRGTEGRKLFAGSAVVDSDGDVVAKAESTWIEVDELPV